MFWSKKKESPTAWIPRLSTGGGKGTIYRSDFSPSAFAEKIHANPRMSRVYGTSEDLENIAQDEIEKVRIIMREGIAEGKSIERITRDLLDYEAQTTSYEKVWPRFKILKVQAGDDYLDVEAIRYMYGNFGSSTGKYISVLDWPFRIRYEPENDMKCTISHLHTTFP